MPDFEFNALIRLLLQIVAIVIVSRALGLVMRRIGQPLVIAEVLGGILLGPSVLGWLWPEGMAMLFPPDSLDLLKVLSQVGLVLFMFVVGLELDPSLLRGRTRSSIAISQASIAVPFLLGIGAATWLYEPYAPAGVGMLPFMLFLGIALSITAFPVLVRILTEQNLFASTVGVIAIACAAVNDVSAWCVLAFVVAISRAQGIAHAIWTTALSIAFILIMLYAVRPFLRSAADRLSRGGELTWTLVAAALLTVLIASTITEMIGIHALFGAFLAGVIFPRRGKLADALAHRIEGGTVVLLLPLFFAFSGLRTEIGLLNQPMDWLVAIAIIALASVGKFGGTVLAARATGLQWPEASAIAILMNTRGLMELIALNIGMDLGVISPTMFTMLVIMALVTTFATSPILRKVYPTARALADDSGSQRASATP